MTFRLTSGSISELPTQLSGYELFTSDSAEGWAYLTFVKWDVGQISAFQIALGKYEEAERAWRIYGEGTAD